LELVEEEVLTVGVFPEELFGFTGLPELVDTMLLIFSVEVKCEEEFSSFEDDSSSDVAEDVSFEVVNSEDEP